MRANIEKYIQGCNIYIKNKAQRHKYYNNIQSLPIPTYTWKDLTIDFITELLKSKNW